MLIELLLSLATIVIFGAMILGEWRTTPDPGSPKPSGWKAVVQRPDGLLAGCIILCQLILWLPWGFR